MTERIVLAGASGLIGRALEAGLQARGAEVHHLVRRDARTQNEHRWNPERGELDPYLSALRAHLRNGRLRLVGTADGR